MANYSGTRADKEFWAHDQTDTEKEILKIKAHEKQLSVVSHNGGRQGGAAGNNLDGDGNPMAKSAGTISISVNCITSKERLRRDSR